MRMKYICTETCRELIINEPQEVMKVQKLTVHCCINYTSPESCFVGRMFDIDLKHVTHILVHPPVSRLLDQCYVG